MREREEALQTPSHISIYNMLGTPITELAQCVELYDFGHLRRKYRRKLCFLLFGPDVDVDALKRSVLKSELLTGVSKMNKNGNVRKSYASENGDEIPPETLKEDWNGS